MQKYKIIFRKQINLVVQYRLFIAFSLLFFSLFTCCNKQKRPPAPLSASYTLGTLRIQNTWWKDSQTGFACGGVRSQFGKIFKTTDAGQHWKEVYSGSSKSLYDVCFVNDTLGYGCGENVAFVYTVDGGESWKEYTFPFLPDPIYSVTFRNMCFKNNVLFVTGGDNFDRGNSFIMTNGAFNWFFSHLDHELRSGFCLGNDFYAAGYGYLFHSSDSARHYSPVELTGDFFTGSSVADNSTAYMCGYNGGIYKTSDAAKTWKKQADANTLFKKRVHFNSILFTSSSNGWCVGEDGVMLRTTDGETWTSMELPERANLLSVRLRPPSTIVVTSSEGKIYEFN